VKTRNLKLFLSVITLFLAFTLRASPTDSVLIKKLLSLPPVEELLSKLNSATTGSDSAIIKFKLSIGNYLSFQQSRQQLIETLRKEKSDSLLIGLSNLALTRITEDVKGIDSVAQLAETYFSIQSHYEFYLLIKLFKAYALVREGQNYPEIIALINQFLSDYPIKTDYYSYASAWNTLGEVHRNLHNYPKALECYLKALSFSYDVSGKMINPSPLVNLGNLFTIQGKYDSALYYYNRGLSSDINGYTFFRPYVTLRKGQLYLKTGDLTNAFKLVSESLILFENNHVLTLILLAKGTLSKINYELGNIDESLQLAEGVMHDALTIHYYPDEVQDACTLLIQIYESQKKFEKAFQYQQTLTIIHEELYGPEISYTLYDEQLKVENKNQGLEKELLQKREQVVTEKSDTQQLIIVIISGFILASIILSYFTYKRNRLIHSLNINLISNNEEMQAQSEELKASTEQIEALNTNLESIVETRTQRVIDLNKKLQEYTSFNSQTVNAPLLTLLTSLRNTCDKLN
jgi:tetratricopeptide (TPR) repeat protein